MNELGLESTLAIVKPDAVRSGHTGKIIDRIIQSNFRVRGLKQRQLTHKDARLFYIEHKDRPFYSDLVDYMTSSEVVIACIGKKAAVAAWRDMIGATDPADAEKGTIRHDFGKSKSENAVHGSDSPESAQREIYFFFSQLELV